MKKTIHINLSGHAFQIEEEAYQKLNIYMDKIRRRIHNQSEASEVLTDIEARMAELFRMKCPTTYEVVTEALVDEAIAIIGQPEEISDDEESASTQGDSFSGFNPGIQSRRLYRDPIGKVLGGVCSGLGSYFNIDPILFRILFIITVFSGISIVVYVALWIAMPEAHSLSQRVELTGKGFPKGESTDKSAKNIPDPGIYQKDVMPDIISQVARIAAIVFGILISVISFFALTVLVIAMLFHHQWLSPESSLNGFLKIPGHFFHPQELFWGSIGIVMVVGIPLLALFYGGICLIFNIRKGHGWLGLIAFLTWLGGLAILIYLSFRLSGEFSSFTTTNETKTIKEYPTLYLNANPIPNYPDNDLELSINQMKVYSTKDSLFIFGRPTIRIHRGHRSTISVEKVFFRSAQPHHNGESEKIEFFWIQQDSVIRMDPIFTLSDNTLIRNHQVKVDITIPDHCILKPDETMQSLCEDFW